MFAARNTFSDTSSKEVESRQLKRDRIEAIIVLIVTLALFALAFWASSFGNGTGQDTSDYWQMMP